MKNIVYFYKGYPVNKLRTIGSMIDARIQESDEIMLKNGIVFLVYKDDKRYQVYDEDLNLVGEYENTLIGRDELAISFIRYGAR